MKKVISSLPKLRPHVVIDVTTGDKVSLSDVDETVTKLIEFVSQKVRNTDKTALFEDLTNSKKKLSPAEWARQHGYELSLNEIPENVFAKSRVNKLYQHKLISEYSSYVNNPNRRKQPPSYNLKINLGAVDIQMAALTDAPEVVQKYDSDLALWFKCWDKEFILFFKTPAYIKERNIHKYSLPSIQIEKGTPYYYFSIEENVTEIRNRRNKAGLDLNRSQHPYAVTVLNHKNSIIATHVASARLTQLNAKRENILKELNPTRQKLKAYQKLGIQPEKQEVLKTEITRKRNKASRLLDPLTKQTGHEITKIVKKYHLNTLGVENLSWVHGKKYGSKFAHSKTQQQIEHAVNRAGGRIKKVNAKNSSQQCWKCGTKIIHNTKTRTVKCVTCETKTDRDLNASAVIATRTKPYPVTKKRLNGDNCSVSYDTGETQVIEQTVHKSQSKEAFFLTRMKT